MKKFNLEEYNKMCAEFMGYRLITPDMRKHPEKWISSYWENPEFNGSSKGVLCSEYLLQYSTNWNWIMEVVEKIEQLGYRFNMSNFDGNYAEIRSGSYTDEKISDSSDLDKEFISKKEAAVQSIWEFLTIWEFLNWYRENKDKK